MVVLLVMGTVTMLVLLLVMAVELVTVTMVVEMMNPPSSVILYRGRKGGADRNIVATPIMPMPISTTIPMTVNVTMLVTKMYQKKRL